MSVFRPALRMIFPLVLAAIGPATTAAAADWKHIQMNANDGAKIVVDYVPSPYISTGELAQPFWINVTSPKFKEEMSVQARVLVYCDSRSADPSYRFDVNLDYAARKRFTGEIKSGVPMNVRHISYYSECRQTIEVSVDGLAIRSARGSVFEFALAK